MPRLSRDGEAFVVTSSGSEGCYGGWELAYPSAPTEWTEVRVRVKLADLPWGLDHVHAAVVWEGFEPLGVKWEPLLPLQTSGDDVVFHTHCQRPAGAKGMLVRLLLGAPPDEALRVGYGLGINPYCNVVDEADMPLCTFRRGQ